MIERLLTEAGVEPRALDRIAVTNGPGTFAGMRIGLAAAEGLRLSTPAALVPVSSLWAIGQRVVAEHGSLDCPLAIAIDAGRGQVYFELLEAGGSPKAGPALVGIEQASAQLRESQAMLAGSGAALLAEAARARVLTASIEPRALDFAVPAGVLPVASEPVRPLYFRPADAVVQSSPGLRA